MPLKEITNYIIDTICSSIPNDTADKDITKFLRKLSKEKEVSSIRLLICIAIDTKNSVKQTTSKALKDNKYIQNLRKCILAASRMNEKALSFPNGLTNKWKFAWALNNMILNDKKPCVQCKTNTEYSRIYNFRSYMLWVVDINKSNNIGIDYIIDNPEDLNMYYSFFKNSGKYTDLIVTKLGYGGFVFVADKTELLNIGYTKISKIIDGLGLYIENVKKDEMFVCLEYDANFKEVTWQPDSLTGDWGKIEPGRAIDGNDFFLSFYQYDTYGRTYSVSGKGSNFKERVHLPLNLSTNKYLMKALDLGFLPDSIIKGSDIEILKEALIRYSNA